MKLENDLLKKTNELLKKGLSAGLQLLSDREKTQLVDALKHIYVLWEIFPVLGLARSSYFYHCSRLRGPDKYTDARADRHRLHVCGIFNTIRPLPLEVSLSTSISLSPNVHGRL